MALALKEGNPLIDLTLVDKSSCQWAIAYLNEADLINVRTFTGDSVAVGTTWCEGPVDLLVVDADHTEAGVRADIAAWLPQLPIGSQVFFHDYDADETWFAEQERYPGVKVAVDQLMAGHEIICRVGTAIVYQIIDKEG